MEIVDIHGRPGIFEPAAEFFWRQWGSQRNCEFYRDAMLHSKQPGRLPKFYLALEGGTILGSSALLANDLVSRHDLMPWVGCLYVIPEARGRRLGGRLLDHAAAEAGRMGHEAVYLCTDLEGYYEKYGWSFIDKAWLVNGEEVSVYRRGTGGGETGRGAK